MNTLAPLALADTTTREAGRTSVSHTPPSRAVAVLGESHRPVAGPMRRSRSATAAPGLRAENVASPALADDARCGG